MKALLPFLLLGCALGWSVPANAQDESEKATDTAGAKDENEAPVVDDTQEVAFQRLTGLYIEGRGGVFFTVAGARGYSNGQPFFGFEFGYDFTERLSAQVAYYSGYQAANPLVYPEECTGEGCSDYHLDFGLTFFNLSADYDILYGRRWALEARLGGGVVIINPSAEPGQSPVDFDVFGGLRFEYYTLLTHFTLGAEFDFYYVLPTGIPAMSIAMSILYNF